MVNVVGYVLLPAGIIVFGIGYVRNRRNLMLFGTVLMLVGAALSDMVKGFVDGWKAGGK